MRAIHVNLARGAAMSALAMVLLAPAAQAAESAVAETAEADNGSEIIVTARRVAESAQDVPIAVTALSSETLAARHITDPQSLQGQVPSLSVGSYGQARDVQTYTLRGQGQGYGGSPAVVTYMNDVPLIALTVRSIQGPVGTFLDLQNVQVVNGPQGTLFGRNTTGGAVILTPAVPTDKLEGYVQLEAGNFRDRAIEAVVNVPVSSTLALRFAGHRQTRKGFTRDIVVGTDYDNKDYEYGRASALWKPTDRLENLTVGYYSKSRSNGTGNVAGVYNVPFYNGTFAAVGGCAGVGLGANCSVLTDLTAAQAARGPRRIALGQGALGNTRVIGWGVTNRTSYELTDSLAIRNIASISHLRARVFYDPDGSLFFLNGGPNRQSHVWPDSYKQYTEELQLQGDAADRKVQYTFGIYYERVKTDRENINEQFSFLSTVDKLSMIASNKRSYGLYGQTTVDLGVLTPALDGLNFTGGIRHTSDNLRGAGTAWRANSVTAPVIACSNGVSSAPQTRDDCTFNVHLKRDAVTWTAGLDYHLIPEVLTYFKVSKGYKAGGINAQSVNPVNQTYEPEFVTAYEIGAKTSFAVGAARGTFNLSAYSNDYSNIQKASGDFNAGTGAAGSAIFNAAAATIKGIEADLFVRLDAFDFQANYSHIDGKYKEYKLNNPFGQVDCSGVRKTGIVELTCIPMEGISRNQFSVTGNYTVELAGDAGRIRLSANYAYTGPRYVMPSSVPALEPGSRIDGYGLLNLSVGWQEVLGTSIDVKAFMTNATNKVYRVSNTNVFGALGYQTSLYGEPRMYGIQTKFAF